MTDQELAHGIAKGCPRALQRLVDEFYQPLFRYLWQASGSREDAEDLASHALLRVRRDAAAFQGNGSLRAWIYRVAYRELLGFWRRQRLTRAWSRLQTQRQEAPRDDQIVIEAALAKIPEPQRAAFLLTEVEGLSLAEASLVLGVPAGTVKSRVHHARLKLRDLLCSTYGESHD